MEFTLVIGRPGTGKTSELLRQLDVLGGEVVMVSHTRAAVGEIRDRVGKSSSNIKTIHSLCFNILNVPRDTVVNEARVKEFATEFGFDPIDVKLALSMPDEDNSLLNIDLIKDEFDNWIVENGLISFNGMLNAVLELADVKLLFNCDWLLVDEGQDLSPEQWDVIYRFIDDGCVKEGVIVAGDDYQSIYGWAGADPKALVKFKTRYQAKVKFLEQSHRVPITIHDAAIRVINILPNAHEITDMVFKPTYIEGDINLVSDLRSLEFLEQRTDEDVLIVYRSNYQRSEVENYLIGLRHPYKVLRGTNKSIYPGLFDSDHGRAARAITKIMNNDQYDPSSHEISALRHVGNQVVSTAVERRDWDAIRKLGMSWQDLIQMHDDRLYAYLFEIDDLMSDSRIRIGTIHQSKGLEADHVIYMADLPPIVKHGLWELGEKFEEEVRIVFVAMTRARRTLTIVGYNDILEQAWV